MVMHSNEKGECCLRILVDHSRKRYINTFGSVTSSPSRSSKRGEVVDEFRQHDGVVTVLVKNNLRRASPKLYDGMIEVCNCGGGHRTRLRETCVF